MRLLNSLPIYNYTLGMTFCRHLFPKLVALAVWVDGDKTIMERWLTECISLVVHVPLEDHQGFAVDVFVWYSSQSLPMFTNYILLKS